MKACPSQAVHVRGRHATNGRLLKPESHSFARFSQWRLWIGRAKIRRLHQSKVASGDFDARHQTSKENKVYPNKTRDTKYPNKTRDQKTYVEKQYCKY